MSSRRRNNNKFTRLLISGLITATLLVLFGFNFAGYHYQGLLHKNNITISSKPKTSTSSSDSGSGVYTKDGTSLPNYTGEGMVSVNGDKPYFTVEEINSLNTQHYYNYKGNDTFGRAGVAMATITKADLVPSYTRKGIELPNPVGWVGRSQGGVYDRGHLIAYTLGGRNDLTNLVVETISLNQKYMTQVEGDVRDYINSTGKSVLYRVTPIYQGNELIPRGVEAEAYSQDGSLKINKYLFNVEKGFTIDYSTGNVTSGN